MNHDGCLLHGFPVQGSWICRNVTGGRAYVMLLIVAKVLFTVETKADPGFSADKLNIPMRMSMYIK